MRCVRGMGMRVWIVLLRICTNLSVLIVRLPASRPLVANAGGDFQEHCRCFFSGDGQFSVRRKYSP